MQTLTVTARAQTVEAEQTIVLTPEQESTRQQFEEWFYDNEAEIGRARISGYAGVGKTTLLIEILKLALEAIDGGRLGRKLPATYLPTPSGAWEDFDDRVPCRILLCAPTHAALNVMRAKVVEAGISHRVTLATIHSACAMRMVRDGNGDRQLQRDEGRVPAIADFSLVAIDEIQMLNKDLVTFLEDHDMPDTRVLLLGDPAQPPPVGEISSSAFKMDVDWGATLTDVVRYSGSALTLATRLRDDLYSPRTSARALAKIAGEPDGTLVFASNATEAIVEAMQRLPENPFAARLLATHNAVVTAANERVRALLGRTHPYEVGETLIANAPITRFDPDIGESEILVNNGAVLKIVDRIESGFAPEGICMTGLAHVDPDKLARWCEPQFGVVTLGVETTDGDLHTVHVCHGATAVWFAKTLVEAKAAAKALPRFTDASKAAWRSVYQFEEYFAPVGYSYASTVHKATGLTFDEAFVLVDDFQSWKRPERNRLLYTACTRAAKRLFVVSREL